MKKIILTICALLFSTTALAIEPTPEITNKFGYPPMELTNPENLTEDKVQEKYKKVTLNALAVSDYLFEQFRQSPKSLTSEQSNEIFVFSAFVMHVTNEYNSNNATRESALIQIGKMSTAFLKNIQELGIETETILAGNTSNES